MKICIEAKIFKKKADLSMGPSFSLDLVPSKYKGL